jgi:hypothetical protein
MSERFFLVTMPDSCDYQSTGGITTTNKIEGSKTDGLIMIVNALQNHLP